MENDKLVRLSDVSDLQLKYAANDDIKDGWFGAIDAVMNLPAVDAVEVVRCGKCRFNTSEKKCLHPDSIIKIPDDNDYCSYGDRREDGDAQWQK